MIYTFSGRAEVKDGKVMTFAKEGVQDRDQNEEFNINSVVPAWIRGFAVAKRSYVESFVYSYIANKDHSACQFKVCLIRVPETGTAQIYESATQQPSSILRRRMTFLPDDMSVQRGDLISVAWKRVGTSGDSSYYLEGDGAILVRKL